MYYWKARDRWVKVPCLLTLKRKVDQSSKKGQYFLTGSQNLSVLKSVAESLAGRVGIVQLDPLTPYELTQTLSINWIELLLTQAKELASLKSCLPISLYDYMWRGGLPGLLEVENEILGDYFYSYVSTYVERDIRLLAQVQEVRQFGRFLSLMSALTAQEINYSQLGREIELSPNTAKRWCSVLEQTYQLTEILPYEGNAIKRISKKTKIFQRDLGLVCYLQKISSSTALSGHPMLGALFETLGVHIVRQFSKLLPTKPQFYHWRTNGGAEVDLVLERDGRLFPIEFKCKSNLSVRDFSGMNAFFSTYPKQADYGAIVYAGERVYKGTENIWLIPWNAC